MIYHYMGAELKIKALKPGQILVCENKTGIRSEHHISELKADDGVKEIDAVIEALDTNKTFWDR